MTMARDQALGVIGILGMGAMGAGFAASLARAGLSVATHVADRSEATRLRAIASQATCHDSFSALIAACDTFVSLVPSDQAEPLAQRVALALPARSQDRDPLHYVDANSIMPSRTRRIQATVEAAGAAFSDGGIIGPPPQKGRAWTRCYVSGPHSRILTRFANPEVTVTRLGQGTTQATEMKVLFAAVNKGTVGLLANVFAAARGVGLYDAVKAELESVRPQLLDMLAGQAGDLDGKAARWAVEMQDLAAGLEEMRADGGYHEAAAHGYARLAVHLQDTVDTHHNDELQRVLAAWLKRR